MAENIIAALVGAFAGSLTGGVFALLTLVLTQRSERQRRAEDAQSQREAAERSTNQWYAEFYMTKRLDALSDLQLALIRIRNLDWPSRPRRPSLFPERRAYLAIKDELFNLERVRTVAETYLDAELRNLLGDITTQMEEVQRYLPYLSSDMTAGFRDLESIAGYFKLYRRLLQGRLRPNVSNMDMWLPYIRSETARRRIRHFLVTNEALGINLLTAIGYISEQLNPQSLRFYAEQQKPQLTTRTELPSIADPKSSRHSKLSGNNYG